MTLHPEIPDNLGIPDTAVNMVMMKRSMQGTEYLNAQPYLVIDMALLKE